MTEPILFSGDHRLEGILEWPEGVPAGTAAGGVVVAHPHPLYGGTMAQPVVYRVARACREQGLASLRFNFRGVGRSGGRYSGLDEHRDVEAALAFLRGKLSERSGPMEGRGSGPRRGSGRRVPLGLAGYSFGSRMAALAAGSGAIPIDALALIAFVVEWEEPLPGLLDALARFKGPVLAVCGEADDLAPPTAVERALRGSGADYRLAVVPGAGHFFEQNQKEVGEQVADFFATALGGARTQPKS